PNLRRKLFSECGNWKEQVRLSGSSTRTSCAAPASVRHCCAERKFRLPPLFLKSEFRTCLPCAILYPSLTRIQPAIRRSSSKLPEVASLKFRIPFGAQRSLISAPNGHALFLSSRS